MPKFIVCVREIYIQPYEVEARDEDDAKEIVREGGGDILEEKLEYSHTLDTNLWTVEKVEEDS